jgi:hypothetical protein
MISGGAANVVFEMLTHQAWLASCARLTGWVLLGGMLGWGMSYSVPNLSRGRAAIAGAIGGLGGASAFVWLASSVGSSPARWVGAAILGFGIGLMVALVEMVFREAWLDIYYGPKECRTFSLGKQRITIGSGPECTVYVSKASPLALSFILEDGRIRCARGGSDVATTVSPEHEELVGSVRVVVRGHLQGNSSASDGAVADLWLQLSPSKRYRLALGERLTAKELPGVLPRKGEGAVTEVVANPKDRDVLGLKNLSKSIWSVVMPDGNLRKIEPGQSLQLRVGAKINFGEVKAEIASLSAGCVQSHKDATLKP